MKRLQQLLILGLGLATPLLALAEEAHGTCEPNEFCFQVQGYYILDFIAFVAIIVSISVFSRGLKPSVLT